MTSTDAKRVEITIGEIASTDVQQSPPEWDFTYIDISSVDRETKAVVEPKHLSATEAPSRARQLLRGGDVLISMTRPNLNAVALVPDSLDGAVGSTGFYVLRSEHVAPKYLYYLVQTEAFVSAMSAKVQGALYPAIRPKDIHEFAFHLETPERQTRIVAKLEELLSDLDAGVAELKAAQAKLAQYRQSLLKAAVEGALTADWRARRAALETDRPAQPADAQNRPRPAEFHASFAAGQRRRHETPPTGGCAVQEDRADGFETGAQLLARILAERRACWEARQLARFESQGKTPPKGWQSKYPEPVAPDTRDLPELPEGWVWASIEQVSSGEDYCLAIGPFGSNLKVEDYRESGVPLVFVRNIRSGVYSGPRTNYVTREKAKELRAHSVEPGDVLVTKMGEPPGDADVYPADQPLAIITADCIKVRCNTSFVRPAFLKVAINSSIGKQQIRPMTKGVAQKKVSLGRFAKLAVPVPPIQEQDLMIHTLASAERVSQALDGEVVRGLRQSAAQRQNLLKAAFSGQLVPQDPNDEPASVLVERIRALQPARAYRSRKKVTA